MRNSLYALMFVILAVMVLPGVLGASYIIEHESGDTGAGQTYTIESGSGMSDMDILAMLRANKQQRDLVRLEAERDAALNSYGYDEQEAYFESRSAEQQSRVNYFTPGMNNYYGYYNPYYGNQYYNFPEYTYESCEYQFSPFYHSWYRGWPFSYNQRYYYNNGMYTPYGGCGGYGDYYRNYNSPEEFFFPYYWYRIDDGEFKRCNDTDFKEFDCSYRWDGSRYYYYAPFAEDFFQSIYDFDEIDVTDRFALINGRYVLCPDRHFDHDECVFYYKGGKFFFDDPRDNDFLFPNVEMDTDLDDDNPFIHDPDDEDDEEDDDNDDDNDNSNYYDNYPQFNYVNDEFVSCTSNCQYYLKDGRYWSI